MPQVSLTGFGNAVAARSHLVACLTLLLGCLRPEKPSDVPAWPAAPCAREAMRNGVHMSIFYHDHIGNAPGPDIFVILFPTCGCIFCPGRYRVAFGTEAYMAGCRASHPGVWPPQPFYPTVSVVFQVAPGQVGW